MNRFLDRETEALSRRDFNILFLETQAAECFYVRSFPYPLKSAWRAGDQLGNGIQKLCVIYSEELTLARDMTNALQNIYVTLFCHQGTILRLRSLQGEVL